MQKSVDITFNCNRMYSHYLLLNYPLEPGILLESLIFDLIGYLPKIVSATCPFACRDDGLHEYVSYFNI